MSPSLDVNGDTLLTPLDAVLVINYLNSHQPSQIPSNATPGLPYIDTSADNLVTPLDAVLVINAPGESQRVTIRDTRAGAPK